VAFLLNDLWSSLLVTEMVIQQKLLLLAEVFIERLQPPPNGKTPSEAKG
jgi:hypothetical protein